MSAAKPGALSASRPGATPERGIAALAAIYSRAIARYREDQEVKGGPDNRPEDAAKEIKNGCDATAKYT